MTTNTKTQRSRATSPGILAAFQALDDADIDAPLPEDAVRGMERVADANDRKPPRDPMMSIAIHVTARPASNG